MQVVADPDVVVELDPFEVHAGLWLLSPSRADAGSWPDPWELERTFGDRTTSAGMGAARALASAARAYRVLARLDAEALCTLGRRPDSYGDALPEGYLFGLEGCAFAGDDEGARQAWDHWQAFATPETLGRWDWPPPPADDGLPRVLPVSGLGSADGPLDAAPAAAHTSVYRARGQVIEYSFVLPTDLLRGAEDLERRAADALTRCAACPAGASGWVARPRESLPALCLAPPNKSLPVLIGTGVLAPGQACAGASDPPPRHHPGANRSVADLDDEVARYLTRYMTTVERGTPDREPLPAEMLPTVREMVSRAIHREIGLDALLAGDAATALWGLETAAGTDGATTPRGASDPEMLLSLALVRFRAGTTGPVVRLLDAAAGTPGWTAAAPVARAVARVEVLPAAEGPGVMR